MSLFMMVCNKERPCYKCKESVKAMTTVMGGTITDDFHLQWEYSIEYVEKRVPKHLIDTYFKKLT